ncbi:endonuclease/exonuclease/phosphatase family protein [Aestuariicoccus sp. MJ-SS9]|uniref:endonuclease/exonuclease/phosphatase family protein n=1 Tax=Aestuariicoccus sp. MJ-SS9 TaxID=3079855 RepID=UPI002911FE7F|nr:endonuclease/exonuclease/phosphatase family protein [Aestuariicoccus sp. MJ-SS9]MDU8913569.1 endonuclease/exonuclease/phosphatase family protein [Aestuariicoccus sp. MJ-SS9]
MAQIAGLAPDVLLLTSFDHDHDLVALRALGKALAGAGHPFPHLYAALPNSGMATGLDLDGDGRLGGPRDAQGYGGFAGAGGLALLSRLELREVQDFSALLWRDLPDTAMRPDDPGADVQRLSSTGHWLITLNTDTGPLRLGAFAATPPVFDGPEDRNGRRNRDEVLFWRHLLDGAFQTPAPTDRFVLMGNANLDPDTGDGRREAIARLLNHPRIADPLPGLPTVAWEGPGEMRVSYVLPTRDLTVLDGGVLPAAEGMGPHRMVWVDVDLRP